MYPHIYVDIDQRLIFIDDNDHGIRVSPVEFSLLRYLAENSPTVIPIEELGRIIYGYYVNELYIDRYAIRQHIYRIRKKLPKKSLECNRGFGYVLKNASIRRAPRANTSESVGNAKTEPQLSDQSKHEEEVNFIRCSSEERFSSRDILEDFTEREREIFKALANPRLTDMTNEELAEHFNIQRSTLKKHLTRIYNKLEIHTRATAVYMATVYDNDKQGTVTTRNR